MVEVAIFEKMLDLYRKSRTLEPAWLRDFFSTVGAYRAFIWGKGTRQRPHIKGERLATNITPPTVNFKSMPTENYRNLDDWLNLSARQNQNLPKPR